MEERLKLATVPNLALRHCCEKNGKEEINVQKHLAVDNDDIVRVFSKKPAHDTTKNGPSCQDLLQERKQSITFLRQERISARRILEMSRDRNARACVALPGVPPNAAKDKRCGRRK